MAAQPRILASPALAFLVALLLGPGAPANAYRSTDGREVRSNAERLAALPDRGPADEIIYFVMPDRFANGDSANDRGGIEGDRLDHGFDPTHTGFFQGGDLQGLTERLDYIEGLGVTAIWLTPIFQNKAVQGGPGMESAGYHGYWITDFLGVDAHLGGREAFAAFVDAAQARGLRVYMDIITNHTADVIAYRECHDPTFEGYLAPAGGCPYRSKADYPWTTVGGADGDPINAGFLGDDPARLTPENFARLSDPNWAYSVTVAPGEEAIKNPAWLNDLTLYHNRGDSFWVGESALYGDFSGLDDLNTEHPRVVAGMIAIYQRWISDFGVDGFRIDTVKHVRPDFWAQFNPAILEHARSEGIDQFHIFGEIYEFDPGRLAAHTVEGKLPSTLDFAFQDAATEVIARGAPTRTLARLYEFDPAYREGFETARINPTFLGNHDMGRFAMFLREAKPTMDDTEALARLRLAHALMFFSRGVPTVYYGDEQGFVSDYNDQGARETMFPSVTPIYMDNDTVGSDATPADDNFDRAHPLYKAIAEFAALRTAEPALRRGTQVVRHAEEDGGLFVFSRFDETTGTEVIVAINADETRRTATVAVDGASALWSAPAGRCSPRVAAPGAYEVTVPALDYLVCRSEPGAAAQ